MTETHTILVVVILVFERVIVSALAAPSEFDSLVRMPPIVFTVTLALETVAVDGVHSNPCT